jgi:drug/metabolite transporter (DMT)-like permease
METQIFLAVLFAAACHAGWNAIIKVGLDPLSATTLVSIGAVIVALPFLPFIGFPAAASWPWMASSTILHLLYFIALIEAYRAGDLGQVYPIARGSAPLMTATVTTLFVGEHLSLMGWIGILVLVGGVFVLSVRGGRALGSFNGRAVGFALLSALAICSYSVSDGLGGRASGNPVAFTLWMFVIDGIALVPYALYREGHHIIAPMQAYWRRGLTGGAMQVTSYGIVIWAMTQAPIAIVAALRESSVLFGTLIAVVWLKEPLRGSRIVAALMIVCGLVLVRLQ